MNLNTYMKKIKLNEQDERQFDEDEIDLLHFIFEREFKPPFRKVVKYDYCPYYNRNNEWIGHLSRNGYFSFERPILVNIKDKVCQVFGFSYNTLGWWFATKPHLKSWLEDQINAKITNIV